ncbi:hypothetical protein AcV5_007230 [Taiwanofungus camphoratus]|nr:hypothetical protein AcV5_007230 [Antrodia cinnamomea]
MNCSRIAGLLYSTRQGSTGYSTARFYQHAARGLKRVPSVAFAFDVDGVLTHGPQTIPAAKRALAFLEGDNPTGGKIPYILITNGGGVSEEARCQKLTSQLGFNIQVDQFIQSHTILKQIVCKYADVPVLVLGGRNDEVRQVAEGYGFKRAYTTLDVHAWNPAIWPFHELTPSERQSTKTVNFSQTPIAAIFVFHDPRNWALDIQIICDIVRSGGVIGGPATSTVRGHHASSGDGRGPVELIFCNPDILWKSDYDRPRLGQGAFRVAFQAVYKALTGSEYPYVQYGKPTKETYLFAKQVLKNRFKGLYGQKTEQQPEVYMVGDIAGANAAGWDSILVHTGVYDPVHGPPSHVPTHQAKDVEEAVRWAIQREMDRAAGPLP